MCQVCQKSYKVINANHLFSLNHLKNMRDYEKYLLELKDQQSTIDNPNEYLKNLEFYKNERDKLHKAGIIWNKRHPNPF